MVQPVSPGQLSLLDPAGPLRARNFTLFHGEEYGEQVQLLRIDAGQFTGLGSYKDAGK